MIKFFRNIRKKLAEENKLAPYLRYAVGEIVLVVVGILIALSINNWNEQRKLQNEELNLLADIKSNLVVTLRDLQQDTLGNGKYLRHYLKVENYINNNLPYDNELDSAFACLTFWHSPYITTTAYNTLESKGLDLIKNESLKNDIVNLYEVKLKTLMVDYDKSEWELSQNVVVPFFSKHIRRLHEESLFHARPNDFERLKKNEEFLNILSMIIRQRKRGFDFYYEAMNELQRLIEQIDNEFQSRR